MKKQYVKKGIIFIALAFTMVLSYAKSQANEIKVGVTISPPFVIKQNSTFNGIAINIWRDIARIHNIKYKFIAMPSNIDHAIDELQDGKIDVLVGDISTTRKRLDKVDFSRPYFINTISMAVKKHPLSFSQLLKHYLSLKIINIILWMLLLFVIIANLLWVVEHNKNQAIEKKYFKGIMSVMWVMIYNLLRGGPFSKPESRAGKNLILIWLVIGFISLVLIAANITSELTMHKIYNYSDYSKLSELRGKTAIVVRGRLSVAIAKSLNLNIKIADNLQQAITLLKSSQAALIIEDYNILKLALDKSTHPNIFISSLNIKYDEYAFATRINSKLLPMINKGITRLQDSGQALNICKEYLDDSQSRFCEL